MSDAPTYTAIVPVWSQALYGAVGRVTVAGLWHEQPLQFARWSTNRPARFEWQPVPPLRPVPVEEG